MFHVNLLGCNNLILSRNIAALWESPWRHVLILDNQPGFVEQLDLPSLASFTNSQLIFDWCNFLRKFGELGTLHRNHELNTSGTME